MTTLQIVSVTFLATMSVIYLARLFFFVVDTAGIDADTRESRRADRPS
jgi:hypothetical protein